MTTCPVCLIDHDDATHAATLRVHEALKARLAFVLTPFEPGKPKSDSHSLMAMIGYVPQRVRPDRPPCTVCGGKRYARDKCKGCYDAAKAAAMRAQRAQSHTPEVTP